MKMSKILITGTGGFIFSNVVLYFLQHTKHEVVGIDKLTYAGSTLNAPEVKRYKLHIGDVCDYHFVRKVFELEKPDIVIHGAAESVKEDTIIPYMGPKKIEHLEIRDLWNRFKKRNSIEINHNGVELMNLGSEQQRALTWKNGYGQWKKIKQISRHKYEGKMIHMRQKWGEIDVTPNHCIYNSDMDLVKPSSDQELLSIRSIKRSHSEKNAVEKFGVLEWKTSMDDYLYMIAFYITEGWASFNKANGGHIVGFCQNEKDDIYRIRDIIFRNFGCSVYMNERECSSATVSNKKLYDTFVGECGKGSSGKKIPSIVFKLNQELKKRFVDYLIYFDGHKYTETNKKYCTNSRLLAAQLSTILSMIKQDYSYSRKVFDNERWSDSYCFQLSDVYNGLNKSVYEEYDYCGWVYDLEIDNTHKFVCGLGNVIVHNSHVDNSISDSHDFVRTNVVGTHSMLEAALKVHTPEKFINTSTDEVYGSVETGFSKETDLLDPRSPYSSTKASADLLGQSYFTTFGLPVITTRCSNNFGPRQHMEKFIPKVVTNIMRGKKIPLYGDGKNEREWIYVKDNFYALMTLIEKGKVGEAYNISSGHGIKNVDVLDAIFEILGCGQDLVENVEDRLGHDRRYAVNCDKLKALGWKSKYNFMEALDYTIDWYKKNKWFTKL
jgi:dTDP-glucose 4,6-dehydratase